LRHILKTTVKRLFQVIAFYACLALMGGIFLAGTVLCGGTALLLPRTKAVRVSRRITSTVFNAYLNICQALGLMRLDLRALDALNEHVKQGQTPLVIAANHPSLIDIVLLTARVYTCTCIAKDSLMRHPVLGISARANEYISNASLTPMLKKAIASVAAGSHVLVFPEGTRTHLDVQTAINALGGSASIIAKRARTNIQLVYIQTNSGFLGVRWPLLKCPVFPILYTVRLGELIDSQQGLEESILGMKQAFEKNLTPVQMH
jgi:1-acyl-sn-glycerol-3-phosphate acyltransferase